LLANEHDADLCSAVIYVIGFTHYSQSKNK